jgi:hypothetical protein
MSFMHTTLDCTRLIADVDRRRSDERDMLRTSTTSASQLTLYAPGPGLSSPRGIGARWGSRWRCTRHCTPVTYTTQSTTMQRRHMNNDNNNKKKKNNNNNNNDDDDDDDDGTTAVDDGRRG